MKNRTNDTTVLRLRRRSFKPLRVNPKRRLVGVYTGIAPRAAKLLQAEAEIHNKSVASLVCDIIEARYSNIK